MGSIGEITIPRPEIAVVTSNGRAYYRIVLLMKKIGMPFKDLIIAPQLSTMSRHSGNVEDYLNQSRRVIITTRRERIELCGNNVLCIEDLGDDVGVAKEKLLANLYPSKSSDCLVIGIDPGQRTGIAAYMNHREIESTVLPTIENTVERIEALIDNAPRIRKIVKIGLGNKNLANKIASLLEARYRNAVSIQMVDESGTTSSGRRGNTNGESKDQRAARLIAFRDGHNFTDFNLLSRSIS